MCARERIAPIERKRTIGQVLDINPDSYRESFPVYKAHPGRPSQHVPGFDPARVKVDQFGAGERVKGTQVEVGKFQGNAALAPTLAVEIGGTKEEPEGIAII